MHMQIHGLSLALWWWPEGIGILASLMYFIGIRAVARRGYAASNHVRILSCIGLLSCLYLCYLALWPNIFSFAALITVPGLFMFATLIIWPSLIVNWRKRRIYLAICVVLSGVCAIAELLWLIHLPKIV